MTRTLNPPHPPAWSFHKTYVKVSFQGYGSLPGEGIDWFIEDQAFSFLYVFCTYIYSFKHIYAIHSSVTIRRGPSPSPHRLAAQWFEANLLTELRLTLTELSLCPTIWLLPLQQIVSLSQSFRISLIELTDKGGGGVEQNHTITPSRRLVIYI